MLELRDSNNYFLGCTIIFFVFVSSYPGNEGKKKNQPKQREGN